MKKLNFPRMSLPVIVALNAGINFAIISSIFLLFLILIGNFPGWVILGAIPVLLVQVAFSIGLGIVLGVLNVFFRDVGQFFGIVITFWFWLTPIVYPSSILPEKIRDLLMDLNPIAPMVAAYQHIFVSEQWPEWSTLLIPTVVAAAFCMLGLRLFRKRVGEMVDEL
jgi:lipopolysaccharide transport system permease protein